MVYTGTFKTPLGLMTASAENETLRGLWFIGQKYYPHQADEWMPKPDYPVFKELRIWLKDYFAGHNPRLSLRLDPQGTEFQKLIWNMLLTIPYGELSTYGELAKKAVLGQSRPFISPQAVGGAVGHNPISILIPCHRVVGAGGNLTGYAGGIEKKEALLRLERTDGV
jgi:methylated-DNA-[protein]-cysteine S-methyltransferase